jgi:hypothetical protein
MADVTAQMARKTKASIMAKPPGNGHSLSHTGRWRALFAGLLRQ